MADMGEAEKPHFVLVHGIGGGGWCWYKVRCLMENSGYKVTCVDLKSAGIDQSDANSIVSFEDYNRPLLDFMLALSHDEQVVLVGHSAGGLSVTQVSHRFADKVRLVVYIGATMLKSGFVSEEDVKNGVPDLSEFGDVYDLGFGMGLDKPPTSAMVKKEFQRKIIYQKSPQEDSTLAGMLLRPGPILALQAARFPVERDRDNKVPHVYVKTMQDRVLKPEQQEAMIKRWPPVAVYDLDSDHSPFFSAPFSLFHILVKTATDLGSQ